MLKQPLPNINSHIFLCAFHYITQLSQQSSNHLWNYFGDSSLSFHPGRSNPHCSLKRVNVIISAGYKGTESKKPMLNWGSTWWYMNVAWCFAADELLLESVGTWLPCRHTVLTSDGFKVLMRQVHGIAPFFSLFFTSIEILPKLWRTRKTNWVGHSCLNCCIVDFLWGTIRLFVSVML